MQRRDAMRKLADAALLAGGGGLLSGCTPAAPLKIGFLGGLSGKFADLGIEERNAVLLTLERFNAVTPLPGGAVQLLQGDDAQDPAQAQAALRLLAQQGVEVVIGPATSSIGVVVTPLAKDLGLLLVSPTVTTARLSGQSDALVRVCSDTAANGAAAARVHQAQWRVARYAGLVDEANADYTQSWMAAYKAEAARRGMHQAVGVGMHSQRQPDHDALAAQLLAGRPELVTLCCSSVDAAALIQRLRQRDPGVPIAAAAWAATGRTIELAGRAAEGVVFEQYYDTDHQGREFLDFMQAYAARFSQQPSFAAVLACDAARTVLAALQGGARRAGMREALVGREHAGIQGPFRMDAHGDVVRKLSFLRVQDGRFQATGWSA